MHDFHTYKRSTIRYWERRRIVYNLLLVPPAFISYMFVVGIEAGLGGEPVRSTGEVVQEFVLSAIGANICYSFAYALEFLLGSDQPEPRWFRWGRTVERLAAGNPGDVRPVGEGVSEMRIDYGPGYRVYYKKYGQKLVILLAGGDKRSQSNDIKIALDLARNL